MKIILFGASGMVGQGVLRECLRDPQVEQVLTVGRSPLRENHAKLRALVQADLYDLSSVEDQLKGYAACFFCLGVSSFRMSEADYAHVTYDLTFAVAQTLARLNPGLTFTYVSGLGTDSTEKGRTMWARVKGKTENALLRLPFKAAYLFRPAAIQPLDGIRSKTPLYQLPYTLLGPFIPFLLRWLPNYITTTERVGRAMLHVAKQGAPKPILESADINRIGS
jgi:uncharacterized protein YbjT (DUF2867 family)